MEERKAKIASLKSRTTCRRCGAVGHWSGDSQCPASKGGGRKGRTRSGSVGSSSPPSRLASKGSSSSKQRTVYFAIHEPAPASGSHVYRALCGDGFHAVPPPSSLTGHTGSHAPHETLDEHVPHDALVPAHGSRVPAETRHQCVDLSHGQGCGDVHAEMRGLVHDLPSLYSRPLTMKEELMLQQALGRLSQLPNLPMEIDGFGIIENRLAVLLAEVFLLPARGEHARPDERGQPSSSGGTPDVNAGSAEQSDDASFSPQPANYQQTVCPHEHVISRGTNKYVLGLPVAFGKGTYSKLHHQVREGRHLLMSLLPLNADTIECHGVERTPTCGGRHVWTAASRSQQSPAESIRTSRPPTWLIFLEANSLPMRLLVLLDRFGMRSS